MLVGLMVDIFIYQKNFAKPFRTVNMKNIKKLADLIIKYKKIGKKKKILLAKTLHAII